MAGSLAKMLKSVAQAKATQETISKDSTLKNHYNTVHAGGHTPANPKAAPVEKLRRATVAGNWSYLFRYLAPEYWGNPVLEKTGSGPMARAAIQLGKFHYVMKNGRPHFKPFTQAQILSFLRSRNYVGSDSSYCNDDVFKDHARVYFQRQQAAAKKYPPTDWRHVVEIYPGQVLCEEPNWRPLEVAGKVAAVAVGTVAAVTLGPQVFGAIKGSLAGAAGGGAATGAGAGATAAASGATAATASTAAAATKAASLFTTIKTTGNKLLTYFNQARTIDAIAKGELPPPPISITGNSFTEWALDVAKKEIKEKAIAMGQEHLAEQMYKDQEAQIRAEILALQRQLAGATKGIPKSPDPRVPGKVQTKSAELALQQKQLHDRLAMAAVAVPILALLLRG